MFLVFGSLKDVPTQIMITFLIAKTIAHLKLVLKNSTVALILMRTALWTSWIVVLPFLELKSFLDVLIPMAIIK